MRSNLSILGAAVEGFVQHLLSLQPQFDPAKFAVDSSFHFDADVLLLKVDTFAVKRLEQNYSTTTAAAQIEQAKELLKDRAAIVHLYQTCVRDHGTIDAIRKIRMKTGCDVAEGRLVWELIFEMARPVNGGKRCVGI
jgi:hypothetical protein